MAVSGSGSVQRWTGPVKVVQQYRVRSGVWAARGPPHMGNAAAPASGPRGATHSRERSAWAQQRHKDIPENIRSYHHQSGISIESLTADSARTRVMVLISAHDKTETTPKVSITLAGVYHDEWHKTPEGWRFARRTLKV